MAPSWLRGQVVLVALSTVGACNGSDGSDDRAATKEYAAFCQAYAIRPDVPPRELMWRWALSLRRTTLPTMTPLERTGLDETIGLYRAMAKGREPDSYDREAVNAFRAFARDRCGPSPFEMTVRRDR